MSGAAWPIACPWMVAQQPPTDTQWRDLSGACGARRRASGACCPSRAASAPGGWPGTPRPRPRRAGRRQPASRASVRRPSASASATWHPGSPSWRQSVKRQPSATSSTSANVSVTASTSSSRPTGADAGRVDQHAAARQHVQLPRGGGVAALGVAGAHPARAGRLAPEQRVHDARLAGPGLAEQRDGAALDPGPQLVEPAPLLHGHDQHVDARLCLGDRADQRLRVVGERRLGEHDHGLGARIARQRRAALDPARLHRPVDAAHQQHHVDVRRQRLLALADGRPAPQQRPAGQHRHRVVPVERDPVADDGLGVEARPEGDGHDAVGARHEQARPVVTDHPTRDEVVGQLGEPSCPTLVPPVRRQRAVGHVAGTAVALIGRCRALCSGEALHDLHHQLAGLGGVVARPSRRRPRGPPSWRQPCPCPRTRWRRRGPSSCPRGR